MGYKLSKELSQKKLLFGLYIGTAAYSSAYLFLHERDMSARERIPISRLTVKIESGAIQDP